jgi:hypothetical protein
MADRNKRLDILAKVASGELSLEESAEMLRILDEGQVREQGSTSAQVGKNEERATMPAEDLEKSKWKNWWMIPFVIFTVLTILSGFLVFTTYQNTGLGVGFWFALLFLLLMLAGMIVSILSARAPWLHIRIRRKGQGRGRNINLSFPLPLGAAFWVTKHVRGVIPPHLQDKDIPGAISSLKETINREQPIEIHVDDDDDDQEVNIYIG